MKKIVVLVFCFALVIAMPLFVYAQEKQAMDQTKITDVGNKFCPVSGDKVSGTAFVEHNGKRYGLCCPMCAQQFKNDPEKYIEKMNKQEAGEAPKSSMNM